MSRPKKQSISDDKTVGLVNQLPFIRSSFVYIPGTHERIAAAMPTNKTIAMTLKWWINKNLCMGVVDGRNPTSISPGH